MTQGFATLEEGLKLFDQVSKSKLTIITEGYNTWLISKALELYKVKNIEVLNGAESNSGDNQLKTLYEFFSRFEHSKKVIFVWDWDVKKHKKIKDLEFVNNTYPFIFERNNYNKIAENGIENLFPESLFDNFKNKNERSTGEIKITFDSYCKRKFEKHVLERNNIDDFEKFKPLIEKIQEMLENDNLV